MLSAPLHQDIFKFHYGMQSCAGISNLKPENSSSWGLLENAGVCSFNPFGAVLRKACGSEGKLAHRIHERWLKKGWFEPLLYNM